MNSTSSPEVAARAGKGKRTRKSGKKKSHKSSASSPSKTPSSTEHQASHKSQRMAGAASTTSKKEAGVSSHRKGTGSQPTTPDSPSGAARGALVQSNAAAADGKAPATPSSISSSPVPTTSGVRGGATPDAPSYCRNQATATLASTANDERGVKPRKAPDSASVPTISEVNLDHIQHPEPYAVAVDFAATPKGLDHDSSPTRSILAPVSELKPSQTMSKRPPPLPGSKDSNDAATSTGSRLGSIRKKLPPQFTKDKTRAEPSDTREEVLPKPAPAMNGANYYSSLRELATSIQTDSATPRGGDSKSMPTRLWHVLILVALASVVVVLLYLRLWGTSERLNVEDGSCRTKACYRHASYFTRSLNFSADPCIDFDAFVCSKWKPTSDLIPTFAVQMIATHMHRMTRLLRQGSLNFNASSMSAAFLRECIEQTENEESLMNLKRFAADQGIPWPYEKISNRNSPGSHPLHVVFRLSLEWGFHTWFEITVGKIKEHEKTTHALFIDSTIYPSVWLNFIRKLKTEGARRKYYEGFCTLLGAPFPSPAELQRRFDIEDSVLSILHEVGTRGRHLAMKTPRKLAALTRNVSLTHWLELAKLSASPSTDPSGVPFYFAERRIIQAIDKILCRHEQERVLEHLAWWFVQQHTVLGSPSAHILFAGDKQRARRRMYTYCYKIVSEKMGLLVAAESAISLFSARERENAQRVLDSLINATGKFIRLLPWSEEGDRYMASTITHIQLIYWPDELEDMDNRLSFLYRNFVDAANDTQSFFSMWIRASEAMRSLNYGNYHLMHLNWRSQLRTLFEYDYWSNQLQVSHAALAPPLYYASNYSVLRAATFGAFGSQFLAAVFSVINLAAFLLEKQDLMVSLLSRDGIKLFKDSSCGSAYENRLKETLAVAGAWHLFQHSGSAAEDGDTSLVAIDGRLFTAEEMFFVTYCRSVCDVHNRSRCRDVLRQVSAFAATFKCKDGTPMRMFNRCGVVKDFERKLQNSSVLE